MASRPSSGSAPKRRTNNPALYQAVGPSFVKMHGLGNDFVILDGRHTPLDLTPPQIQAVADRRHGIGCDQLIIIDPPTDGADARMRIFNADGSEVGACGNASRCVVWLLSQNSPDERVTLLSKGGRLQGWRDGSQVSVTMGRPRLDWQEIPLSMACDTLHVRLNYHPLSDPVAVSMGNPHAVFFVPDAEAVKLSVLGPGLENHALFPERCNIEVAQILGPDRIRMRVWERGAGITPACGTGACATVVAAIRRGLIPQQQATVVLDGGELMIRWDDEVTMTGAVSMVASGTLDDSVLCPKS